MNKTAEQLLSAARLRGLMIATAESCTGGMIAAALTSIAGSSDVFERGFVTYSNVSKQEMLGVQAETLARHGAVSAETAREMAAGALARSSADLAVSVTGIAGPEGGSPEKPVGLVWFGLARTGHEVRTHREIFSGRGREAIRQQAAELALSLMLQSLR